MNGSSRIRPLPRGRGGPDAPPLAVYGLLLLAICALGAALRLYHLGTTLLWIDEIGVLFFANQAESALDLVRTIYHDRFAGPTGQHMPFQYVWMRWLLDLRPWRMSFEDIAWVRLPFTALGIATLPLIAHAASRLYGRRTGLWTAFLVAISFFHVYTSRDATSYAPLLFFLALNGVGLAALADPSPSASCRLASGACFCLGAAGALWTHANAWFFLGVQGLLLLLAQARAAARVPAGRNRHAAFFRGPFFRAAVLLLLATLPVLPLMWGGRATFFASEQATGTVPEKICFGLLAYLPTYFGWGRAPLALALFIAAVVGGAAGALARPHTRPIAAFQLALLVLPVALFLAVLTRNFAPRYVAFSFLPLIVFAGHGIACLTDVLAHRFSPAVPRLFTVAVCAALALAHAAPFRLLYRLSDKLHPIRPAYDWIVRNVPAYGLYVMRSSHYMRDLQFALPMGRNYTCMADYPGHDVPEDLVRIRSANARSFFDRIPLAILVTEPDVHYPAHLWTWIHPYFSRTASVSIFPDQLRLWQYGFWPHGWHPPDPFDFTFRYNTEKDIIQRATAAQLPGLVLPVFGGWVFFQSAEWHLHLAAPQPSTLRLYNLTGKPADFRLRVDGFSWAEGLFHLSRWSPFRDQSARTLPLPANSFLFDFGTLRLLPGPNDFNVHVQTQFDPAAFIYSFHLELLPQK